LERLRTSDDKAVQRALQEAYEKNPARVRRLDAFRVASSLAPTEKLELLVRPWAGDADKLVAEAPVTADGRRGRTADNVRHSTARAKGGGDRPSPRSIKCVPGLHPESLQKAVDMEFWVI
jgi:hypothetical protein